MPKENMEQQYMCDGISLKKMQVTVYHRQWNTFNLKTEIRLINM